MSSGTADTNTRAGDITKFTIGDSPDFSPVVQELKYYESVFQPSIEVQAYIMETGMTDTDKVGPRGVLDSLPIRGGEKVLLNIEDNQESPNKLVFKGNKSLYVNRISGIDPGTQKDIYTLEFCPREYLTNNQTRVVKRYEGRISTNVTKILKETIKTQKNIDTDTTAVPYNFIGNDKKPFHVCSWLAPKAIPELMKNGKPAIGGAAGYLFFETFDGYKFKAVDKLLEGKPLKRYILTGKPDTPPPGYTGKIISAKINRYIDLERNLNLGTYANRSIFFDYYGMGYQVRDYNINDNQKDKVSNAGKQELGQNIKKEFTEGPSRLMSHVLDVGALPAGRTPKEQLEKWKEKPELPNYDAANTMVQGMMRYDQLFTIKTDVMIAGDFSLRAGDLIYCDFPTLTVDHNKETNKQTGGIYMIASLCHRLTRGDCYTSLTLVRDTFGRIPFKETT